ncbi:MAG: hypothetical protein H0W74_13215 [Sphingosinicella sp.]|nr:hypothetical protein [Sphingosinicella sp.]
MNDHRNWAIWAADCAERILRLYEERGGADAGPRKAIEAARKWAAGTMTMADARAAAFAAHASARRAETTAAAAAARSAGHAAATAHVKSHAPHAAAYALKALALSGGAVQPEQEWQMRNAPGPLK